MAPKKQYRRLSKGHIIAEVKYGIDYLLCACGWKGTAYGEDFRLHQKNSEPFIGDGIDDEYGGNFNRAFSLKESGELQSI